MNYFVKLSQSAFFILRTLTLLFNISEVSVKSKTVNFTDFGVNSSLHSASSAVIRVENKKM